MNTPCRFRAFFPALALVCLTAGMLPAAPAQAAAPKNDFVIPKISELYRIDGVLDEPFWKGAEALDGFRTDANPGLIPHAATRVKLAYDDQSLLVAFLCDEPGIREGAPGPALYGDSCELSLFSRPETPYYSPYLQRLDYMNANEAVRTMRRFVLTPTNQRREARVYKVGPHSPYIIDEAWNCPWESAVKTGPGSIVMEWAIPWEQIGGQPRPGHTFRLNFVRVRKTWGDETSCFNWYSSPNITVRPFSSAGFIQEYPTIFASTRVEKDRMTVTRFVETVDPWKVVRDRPEYERALTSRKVPNRAIHFYLGLSDFQIPDHIRKRYDADAWKAEEENLFTEMGLAGANGPFLPGFMNRVGVSGLDSLYRKYGMRFSWHGGVSGAEAKKRGATILIPAGTAAFFDPVFMGMKEEQLEKWLARHGKAPWLFDIRGQDEPFNQIATILQPGTWEKVDGEMREQYGVGLGVPQGIPGAPYQDQPVHENSRTVPNHETALQRIAAFRWLNKTYTEVAHREYEVAKKHAPGALFEAYNRNSVADLDFLDQSLIHPYTDFYSADPYPSFCIYVYGNARSKYHVGFTSKMVTDLACGKPTQMIVQGCEMIQRLSTAENVREWASQAAKAGVAIIDWWGTPKILYPAVYREMLRISKLWMTLPALDIPEKSEVAVLFSDDSRAAEGDEPLDAHYSLHAILGEKLGAWFTFVSENHIRRGLHSLEGKKLLIAPQLGYVSKEFAGDLTRRVENGATLVLLDPDALTGDIETGSLQDERQRLLGLG
ncbi:MAG: beta-galactosidase trimerization domain-containing protein, partial [Candidatus Latescibacterota bacterium]